MPRPKRTTDGQPAAQLHVRLSVQEKAVLKAHADRLGFPSVSDYIREAVLSQGQKPAPPLARKNALSKIDAALLYELNRIGNNLNQISRNLNMDNDVEASEVSRSLVQLDELMEVILPAYRSGLQEGDLIVALGGRTVSSWRDFWEALNDFGFTHDRPYKEIARTAPIAVVRDGQLLPVLCSDDRSALNV